MRNLRRTMALEGAGSSTDFPLFGRVISLEEEAVVTSEADQEAHEIESALSEADHNLDVSDALEELAVVADRVEETTPEVAQLIDTAAQMAVAGSDITPEEMVPAAESFIGRKYAVESIVERAKTIFESIMAFVRKLWDHIFAYFRVGVVVPRLEAHIKKLEEKLKEADKLKEGATGFKVSTGFLAYEGKIVKDYSELSAAVKASVAAAKFVFQDNVERLSKLGGSLASEINKFSPETATTVVEDIRKVMASGPKPAVPGAKNGQKVGQFQRHEGPGLLGGGKLVFAEFEGNADASALGALDHFRRSGVRYEKEALKNKQEVEFKILTTREVEELLKDSKELLKNLKDFHTGGRIEKLKKTSDELKKASSKADAELKKMKKDDKGQTNLINEYRSVMNFNTAFANWTYQPAIPFYGNVIASVRAILLVVSQSLNHYEPKAK